MAKSLTIGTSAIRELDGLFSLNDLHRASGGQEHHAPNRFMRLEQTRELVNELSKTPEMAFKVTRGRYASTYACRELVIAYAAWISAAFHLKVIRVFLAQAAPAQSLPQPFTPEQIAAAVDAAQQVCAAVLGSGPDWKFHHHHACFVTDSAFGSPVVIDTTHQRDETITATVQRLADQLLKPNSYPVSVFLPLWEAVNTRLTGRVTGRVEARAQSLEAAA